MLTMSPSDIKDEETMVEARYSISSLASSIHYNCKKHIYLLSRARRRKESDETQPRKSVVEAHCERGNVFEDNLFQLHKSVMVDHSKSTDFKKILQEAEPNTYLCQLKFKLPEAFYSDVIGNTTAYRINNFIPDFLFIRQDPMTKVRKILIIDAKSSKEMSKSHQFQVASYAFFLKYLVRDIRNLEIDDLGGVWLPSDLDKPVTFRIDFVLNKIKTIYMDTLIEISNNAKPEWILGKKCNSCQFLGRCKQDAKGTVRSIPYMDEGKATRLKESATVEIEDLSELLQNLKIESQADQTSTTGYEGYIDAYKENKPKFLGYASVTIAKDTDHAIYIYLQIDQFSQKPFIYGIETIDCVSGVKVLSKYYHTNYDKHMNDQVETYSDFVDRFVADLAHTLSLMDDTSSRCLIYVYNGLEKSLIQNMLNRIVSSEGSDLVTLDETRRSEIVSDAMRCLIVLFQDTQLLGLPGVLHFPDMDDIQRTSSVGRFVSIEELLQQNVALGVSGFYHLSDAVIWMADSYIHQEDDDLSGLDENDIYNSWKAPMLDDELRYSTSHFINQRFFWLQEIMDCYWSLAAEFMQQMECDLFPLICKPFQWPEVQPFQYPILAKLVFFKQLECIKACDEIRMDRIQDLSRIDHGGSSDETSLGGLVLDFVGQERVSQYVTHLRFLARPLTNGPFIQQKLDRVSIDTFKRYILVPDTREDIISTIRYSDLLYANKTNYVTHAIRCVNVVQIMGNEVVLAGASIPTTITSRRYRLYKRYVDFTTIANIEGLKRLDQQKDVDAVKLIEDPNRWAEAHDDETHLDAAAIQLRDAFSMSPSQKDISVSILEKRLQIIWGPPGSGKTEFLALFVNWYIQCSADKDILIGVTAFTRDAIYNLLKRIEKVQKRHGNQFTIMYVHGPTNDKTFDRDSDIIGCPWDKSFSLIRAMNKDPTTRNIYVMGTTVWCWEKIRTKWKTFKGCDMLILDESTQVLVSEALLAIGCLKRPNGKLIVAGDHMQLGPIIKNDYSDTVSRLDDPLLFGSIQQCLMRTKENHAIPIREFLLQKGALHDFGPNTLQLKDNWRMNAELNEFFQQVYGPDYTSRYPKIKLHLDWTSIKHRNLKKIQAILNPSQAITLVKLTGSSSDMVEAEADVVEQIVQIYLEAREKASVSPAQIPVNRDMNEPKVMIVTPHNKQRIAIQRRVGVRVDTVEKMQGQECDFIIACFSCSNKRNHQFLRDFRRWNVALSRARCKVVILTVDDLINPVSEGILQSFDKTLEPTDGWALLCLLQQWTNNKNSTLNWTL